MSSITGWCSAKKAKNYDFLGSSSSIASCFACSVPGVSQRGNNGRIRNHVGVSISVALHNLSGNIVRLLLCEVYANFSIDEAAKSRPPRRVSLGVETSRSIVVLLVLAGP